MPDWEREEVYGRVRTMIYAGETDISIARHLGLADKTIARYRAKHQIPNYMERGAAA